MTRFTGIFHAHGQNLATDPADGRRGKIGRARAMAAIVVAGLVVAACSSSAATAGAPTDMPVPATPSAAPVVDATGVPTSLDPCQLVTSQEASGLSGASFTAGVEGTTSGGGKTCVYGAQTTNVFTVIVGQAPDLATAKAGKAEAEAAIAAQAGQPIKFIELPNFADGASYVLGSFTVQGQTFNGSAIYALKGTIFFGFSDIAVGQATPNLAALEAQATTILGRLP